MLETVVNGFEHISIVLLLFSSSFWNIATPTRLKRFVERDRFALATAIKDESVFLLRDLLDARYRSLCTAQWQLWIACLLPHFQFFSISRIVFIFFNLKNGFRCCGWFAHSHTPTRAAAQNELVGVKMLNIPHWFHSFSHLRLLARFLLNAFFTMRMSLTT